MATGALPTATGEPGAGVNPAALVEQNGHRAIACVGNGDILPSVSGEVAGGDSGWILPRQRHRGARNKAAVALAEQRQ
jgi:hypothetical protein